MELWIAMIIILVITILVAKHLEKEARKSSIAKFRNTLKYYPLVVIVIWLIPSIDMIINSVSGNHGFRQVFGYFHILALSLQGFINFFLYGYGYVKKLFRKKMKQKRIKRNDMQRENAYTKLLNIENEEHKSLEIADESDNLTDN